MTREWPESPEYVAAAAALVSLVSQKIEMAKALLPLEIRRVGQALKRPRGKRAKRSSFYAHKRRIRQRSRERPVADFSESKWAVQRGRGPAR